MSNRLQCLPVTPRPAEQSCSDPVHASSKLLPYLGCLSVFSLMLLGSVSGRSQSGPGSTASKPAVQSQSTDRAPSPASRGRSQAEAYIMAVAKDVGRLSKTMGQPVSEVDSLGHCTRPAKTPSAGGTRPAAASGSSSLHGGWIERVVRKVRVVLND
jgi:hypothetical protein